MIDEIGFWDAISTALLHTVWQIFLIAGCVWLLLKWVPKKLQKVRCAVPKIGLCFIPLCFALTVFGTVNDAFTFRNVVTIVSLAPFLKAVLLLVWGTSVLYGARGLLADLAGIKSLKALPYEGPSEPLRLTLAELCDTIGIKRCVELRLSKEITAFFTIGTFRPIIFIPISFMTRLSNEEISAILAHELGHIKRLDHAWAWLESIVKTVFFYHPGTHVLVRTLRHETELACDRIATGSGSSPTALAGALLRLTLESRNQLQHHASNCTKANLQDRVERLIHGKDLPRSGSTIAQKIGLGVMLVLNASCIAGLSQNQVSRSTTVVMSTQIGLKPSDFVASKTSIYDKVEPYLEMGTPLSRPSRVIVKYADNAVSVEGKQLPVKAQSALMPYFSDLKQALSLTEEETLSIIYSAESAELFVFRPAPSGFGKQKAFSIISGRSYASQAITGSQRRAS